MDCRIDGFRRVSFNRITLAIAISALAGAACSSATGNDALSAPSHSKSAKSDAGPTGSSGGSSGSGSGSDVGAGSDDGSVASTGSSSGSADSSPGDAASDDASVLVGDSAAVCAKTITKPSQLVFLGDSYLNWGENVGWDTIVPRIEKDLMTEGSAAYSATPRRYDVAGANMTQIAAQYTTAHNADADIDTIVMDGGGNDILLGDRSCLTNPPTDPTTTCAKTIDTTLSLGKTALMQMQADGVKHILFFFYPHVDTVDANGAPIGGSGKYANVTLDYAYPKIAAICGAISICTFVDTRPAWGENYAMYIDPQGLGVHPNDKGSQLLVDQAIWPAMASHCLAQ